MVKRREFLLLSLLVALVLGIVGFVVWATFIAPPMQEAMDALQTSSYVQVVDEPWIVFAPTNASPNTGLILYPGGRVDPRAYAPAARSLAEHGFLVVIVPMPLNLAVFSPDRANQVIDAYPQVQNWAIGGHSLGGAMAARYAYRHPDRIQGLVLWASYPAASNDLSSSGLHVVSIFGTNDGLATPEKIAASQALLPGDTHWVAIDGGNHAGFGWYGAQAGDNEAEISRAEQQSVIVNATLDLLEEIRESSLSIGLEYLIFV